MPKIGLRVNGKEYSGWESVRVTRGIESIAGSFDLTASDRWAGQNEPWPIFEEDECALYLEDECVINGWVDKAEPEYDAGSHSLSVSGRDAAGALVDCSALLSSWEFKDLPLLTLATKLAAPFGVKVALDPILSSSVAVTLKTGKAGALSGGGSDGKRSGLGPPKPPKKFSVDPGESAFEVLDRACRMCGVLPVSDGKGRILLTRTGTARCEAALVEGQNILKAKATFDASGRYRRYVVTAQAAGSDEAFGKAAAAVTAEAEDLNVDRDSRVLLIRNDGAATIEAAKVRAGWEASVRAARSVALVVLVQGWTMGNGKLWPVNAICNVNSPKVRIKGDMLITQATYSADDKSGTTTELVLKRSAAFTPEPKITTGSEKLFFTGAVAPIKTKAP